MLTYPSSLKTEPEPVISFIPFTRPDVGEREKEAVLATLETGHIGGNGPVSRELEARLQKMFGVKHVQLTSSCSDVLELAMMSMRIGPGDEVVMPSLTFVSTASGVALLLIVTFALLFAEDVQVQ